MMTKRLPTRYEETHPDGVQHALDAEHGGTGDTTEDAQVVRTREVDGEDPQTTTTMCGRQGGGAG